VPARIVDRRGQMPSETKVPAPSAPHGPVQMARHSSTRNESTRRTVQVARFFCVGAAAQFRIEGAGSRPVGHLTGTISRIAAPAPLLDGLTGAHLARPLRPAEGRRPRLVPSRVRELTWPSLIFGRGELLDKIDYGSPKLCVRDLHERLGELVSIGGGEIVCYILQIGSVGWYTALSGFVREPFEEGFHGHLQYVRNLL
jgi:hypothetical protein